MSVGNDQMGMIAGIPIDWIDMTEAISRIIAAARARDFFQVSTVNLDFLVQAHRDPEVETILERNALNIADGAPVVWLGRLLAAPSAHRVAGADLVPLLIEAAGREGIRVFLLGGENGVAEAAAQRLRLKHPGLQVEAHEPPLASLDDMDDETIFRRLDAADPHILLVAFGHPKQEKWIHRNRDRLPMVAIGVGSCLDLIAGQVSRAPSWMQRVGLEWSYRFVHEPGRLARRYAKDAAWLVGVLFPMTLRQRFARTESS
jgi:N-acetylglucosaminyldiphosphoundecaprenol N-acetyl-beta-D-mannosaminyltransferase